MDLSTCTECTPPRGRSSRVRVVPGGEGLVVTHVRGVTGDDALDSRDEHVLRRRRRSSSGFLFSGPHGRPTWATLYGGQSLEELFSRMGPEIIVDLPGSLGTTLLFRTAADCT